MKTAVKVMLIATLLPCVFLSCNKNKLSKSEEKEGWKLLFDGNSLTGWQAYNAPQITGWDIEEGTLTVSEEGTDIITENIFQNFELCWEWRIAPQANSGVMYHVQTGEQYASPALTGPEYQLIDEAGYMEELADTQLTGADYGMYAPNFSKKRKLKDVGVWNSSRIIVNKGKVEHWLNNKKVVEFIAESEDWCTRKMNGKWAGVDSYGIFSKGHICLQNYNGSRVWFKSIKIKEL